jgi:hypothetical protein
MDPGDSPDCKGASAAEDRPDARGNMDLGDSPDGKGASAAEDRPDARGSMDPGDSPDGGTSADVQSGKDGMAPPVHPEDLEDLDFPDGTEERDSPTEGVDEAAAPPKLRDVMDGMPFPDGTEELDSPTDGVDEAPAPPKLRDVMDDSPFRDDTDARDKLMDAPNDAMAPTDLQDVKGALVIRSDMDAGDRIMDPMDDAMAPADLQDVMAGLYFDGDTDARDGSTVASSARNPIQDCADGPDRLGFPDGIGIDTDRPAPGDCATGGTAGQPGAPDSGGTPAVPDEFWPGKGGDGFLPAKDPAGKIFKGGSIVKTIIWRESGTSPSRRPAGKRTRGGPGPAGGKLSGPAGDNLSGSAAAGGKDAGAGTPAPRAARGSGTSGPAGGTGDGEAGYGEAEKPAWEMVRPTWDGGNPASGHTGAYGRVRREKPRIPWLDDSRGLFDGPGPARHSGMDYMERPPLPGGESSGRADAGRRFLEKNKKKQISYFYSGDGAGTGFPLNLPQSEILRLLTRTGLPPIKYGKLGIPILEDDLPPRPEKIDRAKEMLGRPPAIPRSLGKNIESQIQGGFLSFLVRNKRLFRIFDEMIASRYNGRVAVCGKRLGTLYVRVESPHLMERCLYQKTEWLEFLNREIGDEILTDIFFRVLQKDEPFPEIDDTAPPRGGLREEDEVC